MIIFGLGMQGKKDAVPKEVFEWLKKQNEKYPNVQFEINLSVPSTEEQQTEFKKMASQYACVFIKDPQYVHGIRDVLFPYISEAWRVTIIGLENEKGEVLNPGSEEYEKGRALSPELRFEISGMPALESMESYSEYVLGFPRKKDEPVLEKSAEMIPLEPDGGRWTSEVSMTGQKFNELLNDKKTGRKTEAAIYNKDWEALKHLKMRSMH
jgi:hypothetical protein